MKLFSITKLILNHDIPALLLAFDELLQKGFDELQFITGIGSLQELNGKQGEKNHSFVRSSSSTKEKFIEQLPKPRCPTAEGHRFGQ